MLHFKPKFTTVQLHSNSVIGRFPLEFRFSLSEASSAESMSQSDYHVFAFIYTTHYRINTYTLYNNQFAFEMAFGSRFMCVWSLVAIDICPNRSYWYHTKNPFRSQHNHIPPPHEEETNFRLKSLLVTDTSSFTFPFFVLKTQYELSSVYKHALG